MAAIKFFGALSSSDKTGKKTSLLRASWREQLFAPGMLCTCTKGGWVFGGLDWAASQCNRKSCGRTPDVHKHKACCVP
jgi:hypothetical protein